MFLRQLPFAAVAQTPRWEAKHHFPLSAERKMSQDGVNECHIESPFRYDAEGNKTSTDF